MLKNILLWVLAFVITAGIAIYQRSTGPTYPVSGTEQIAGSEVKYKFFRSHGGESDHEVSLSSINKSLQPVLWYKRFKTRDEFTPVPMVYKDGNYTAKLPHQPPAGKLEYYVEVSNNGNIEKVTGQNIVIRFKGAVPMWVLIPHIIAMFGAMMLAAGTGMQYFTRDKKVLNLTRITMLVLGIGGFILGPLMQEYAFGELWTGFPFGHDLTDNKTLIAMIVWLFAYWRISKHGDGKKAAGWALFAAVFMFLIYLIPHSMLGSELDYNELDKNTKQEIINQN